MVNAGRYTARVKDYGLATTMAGDPKVTVLFTFKDEEGKQQDMFWDGFLKSPKSKEITIDALLVCGLKGDDLTGFENGAESGKLDLSREVEIVVNHEEFNGKTRAKIAWVNRTGGASFKDVSPDAVKKLSGLNLKADIMARRKETGIEKPEEKLPF